MLSLLLFALLLPGKAFSAMPDPGTSLVVSTDSTDYEDPFQVKEFILDGPGMLNVFTPNGNIEVEHVSNSNKVRVELYVDRGYAFWSNTKNLDNYRINIFQRGNEIVASVEPKTKSTGLFSDQMTFSYKIFVPEQMSSSLTTTGGHIDLEGVQGTHVIKSGGGNINARDITGNIKASTSGGNIDIHSSEGKIFVFTDGGNITADDNTGELRLQAKAGWIKARRISGTLVSSADAGDIEASFLNVSIGILANTTTGDIDISIPGGFGYDLVLRGSQVNIPSGSTFEGTKRSNFVEGTFNEGGARLNLETRTGTVTLKTEN